MYNASIAYPKPTFDRVLVILDKKEETHKGLILPDSAQQVNTKATVVAVGPGNYNLDGDVVPVDLYPGQRVIIDPGMSQFVGVRWYGEDLALVRSTQVVCLLEPAEEEKELEYRQRNAHVFTPAPFVYDLPNNH